MKETGAELIVADIGGTNARFAIADPKTKSLKGFKSYRTSAYGTFEAALGAFLRTLEGEAPRAISVGAAGPLTSGKIHLTNRDWTVDPGAIAHAFGIKTAVLSNDLVAMAAGIARAPLSAFEPLPGPVAASPYRTLVIAIGTGLGVAWYEHDGEAVMIHPTEAGHMTFAPADPAGGELFEASAKAGRELSFESVISGSGIRFVYDMFREAAPAYTSSEEILISAENNSEPAAVRTLALVLTSLATFSRDLAHVLGSVDEIVFAGGLGRRLKRHMHGAFLEALRAPKGGPLDFSKVAARLAIDDALPLAGSLHLALGSAKFDHPPSKDER